MPRVDIVTVARLLARPLGQGVAAVVLLGSLGELADNHPLLPEVATLAAPLRQMGGAA